jgi:hypothetical protein
LIRIGGNLVGLGCFDPDCRPGRTPFRVVRQRQFASRFGGVLACDRPAAPKQSAEPSTTGKPVTTGPMNAIAPPGASLEVFVPSAHAAASLDSGAASLRMIPLRRLHRPCGLVCSTLNAVQLEMADARGGSFGDLSSHEMTRPPSPAISRAGSPGETERALRRDPTISSATASLVPSDRVMHRRVL